MTFSASRQAGHRHSINAQTADRWDEKVGAACRSEHNQLSNVETKLQQFAVDTWSTPRFGIFTIRRRTINRPRSLRPPLPRESNATGPQSALKVVQRPLR
jgi:hypothetical protein